MKCDETLLRLISYPRCAWDHSVESFVGDLPELCHVMLDADFAGDTHSAKSTRGSYAAIVGPNTFAPIAALCKNRPASLTPARSPISLLVSARYEAKDCKS